MEIRKNFLSLAIPDISEEEVYEVIDCLKSGWISIGPKVKRFEEEFAAYHQVKHAIATSSCTTALMVAAKAIGVEPGNYVIVPTITWQSTANIVEQLGATPLFTDVYRDTMQMNKDDVLHYLEQYGEQIKAIIPVHQAGLPVDIDWYSGIAQKYGVRIIYDAAHAVFSRYKGQMVGQFGDLACFSFYATKNLTTGDGGMITTNDDNLAEACRLWSYHGLPKDSWKRYSAENASPHVQCVLPGYKFNMTDLQAALGLAQLRRRDELLAKRNQLVAHYEKLLADIEFIELPVVETVDGQWGNHVYVIKLLDERLDRDRFMCALREYNIGTNLHFYPVHKNLFYEEKYPEVHLPVAEWLKDRILTIPLSTKYTEDDLEYVVQAMKEVYLHYKQA